jgi:heterodisulfide reductase subunit B2
MKYLYFPGCSLKSTGKPYEESILAVFKAMQIDVEELNDWNCCGATAYMSIDEKKAFALAARNLALAEKQYGKPNGHSAELMAPCSACFLVLTKSQKYFEMYEEVREQTTRALKAAELDYNGTVKVRHPLDILINDFGVEKLAKFVKNPLKGLKVASYYGCQVVRPFETFDDQLYPTSMDRIVKAMGADPVEWPLKTRCCGGSLMGTISEAGLRLNQHLLVEAMRKGADVMVTCCPLCQMNLECFQDAINAKYDEKIHLPVLYFTQLMGLAMGLSEKELGINRLFVKPKPMPVAGKKGVPAHV